VPADELDERRGERAPAPVAEGEAVVVKVLGTDERGRLRLSRRQAVGVDPVLIEF
jgi:hypothetical protein